MKLTGRIYFYKGDDGPPLRGLSSCNTCVIRGEPRLAITDPGPSSGPRFNRLRAAMNDDGLTFQDVNKVIVTHAHPDHTQRLSRLMDKFHLQAYAHPLEKRVLEDPELIWADEFDALGPFAKQATPLSLKSASRIATLMYGRATPCCGITPVREGTAINLGTPAEIIELPGHRPGEIGIHLPEESALITGDLINWKRYDLPSLNMPVSDLAQAESSLKKIQSLDINLLIPAHDQPAAGRDKIQTWLTAAIVRCASLRRRAEEELIADPAVPLAKLGRILAGTNDGVPPWEIKFLAFAVLKSLDGRTSNAPPPEPDAQNPDGQT